MILDTKTHTRGAQAYMDMKEYKNETGLKIFNPWQRKILRTVNGYFWLVICKGCCVLLQCMLCFMKHVTG